MKCLYKQLQDSFDVIVSQNLCEFWQSLSIVNCLLLLTEKWRKLLNRGETYRVLLTGLSKAFKCLPHVLVIANLHTYEVDVPTLRFVKSCLTKRRQRITVNDVYNASSEILFGVPLWALFLIHYYLTYFYITSLGFC